MTVTIEHALGVKQKAGDLVRSAASTQGLGLICRDGCYAIKINLPAPSAVALPDEFEGIPIVYEITGPVTERAK